MKETKKEYNNLNSIETWVVRSYFTWAKSKAPLALRLAEMDDLRLRAREMNIEHLLKGKN